ncbi:hypothetical protein ACFL34_02380 [Candidatus Sumerlaeota bacterium]
MSRLLAAWAEMTFRAQIMSYFTASGRRVSTFILHFVDFFLLRFTQAKLDNSAWDWIQCLTGGL